MESYIEILSIFLCLILTIRYYYLRRGWKKGHAPTNWPVLGMMPGLLQNVHRIHEKITEILEESGHTFEFRGPWFANLDMVCTSDPTNVNHIMSKCFSKYPKSPEYRKILDIYGNGLINANFKFWEMHRKIIMSLMNQNKFQTLLEGIVWQKVEKGLLPVVDNFADQGAEVNLEDIFERFTFDAISKMVLDHDPGCLSVELPHIPCEKAFNDVAEALFQRFILPESCWKLQKWLGIGKEKKMSKAWDAFDQFIYPCIARKEEELLLTSKTNNLEPEEEFDFSAGLMEAYKAKSEAFGCDGIKMNSLLRDVLLTLLLAGRDTMSSTLTWFFWFLTANPSVEIKILEEIGAKLHLHGGEKWRFFNAEESHKLVYLHGALSEALRLFPPVALQQMTPCETDTLPSGHRIEANTRLILSFYSMGRMESIWGNDCMEFKPERWISEEGGIRHVPSYKFPAFNAGPRACLGKDVSFFQMKAVAATLVYNYRIQMIEGHLVAPMFSAVLQMQNGLLVRLSRRN